MGTDSSKGPASSVLWVCYPEDEEDSFLWNFGTYIKLRYAECMNVLLFGEAY
jgi:hypothetical protein